MEYSKKLKRNGSLVGGILHSAIPYHINQVAKKAMDKSISFSYITGNACGGFEKDIKCSDPFYSLEIKTSSDRKIKGNKSYATESKTPKKNKSGYHILVYYTIKCGFSNAGIDCIRFGWLDSQDWIKGGQSSQFSFVRSNIVNLKTNVIFEK